MRGTKPRSRYNTANTTEEADEQEDEFYQALDALLEEAKDVGDDHADERTPEIARELANARKCISQAKEHRVDDLRGVNS